MDFLLDSSNFNLNGFDCRNKSRAAVLAQISVSSMLYVTWRLHLGSLGWKKKKVTSSRLLLHYAPDFGVYEMKITRGWVAGNCLEQVGRFTVPNEEFWMSVLSKGA